MSKDNLVCSVIVTDDPNQWYDTVITERLRAHCQIPKNKNFILRELDMLVMRIRSGEFDHPPEEE